MKRFTNGATAAAAGFLVAAVQMITPVPESVKKDVREQHGNLCAAAGPR